MFSLLEGCVVEKSTSIECLRHFWETGPQHNLVDSELPEGDLFLMLKYKEV